MRTRILCLSLVSATVAVGCEDASVDPITVPSAVSDASTTGDAAWQDSGAQCSEGAQQSCVCVDAGVGTQRCSGGRYGMCEGCASTPQVKCVAGSYKGVGEGTATSNASLVLIWKFPTKSKANWSFSLAANGSSEFFTVGNGCVHLIDPMTGVETTDSRVYITGTVDCSTGRLNGEIRGFYIAPSLAAGLDRKRFNYKGTIKGTFDPATNSFRAGTFAYQEPKVDATEPGHGEGTWSAGLTTDILPNETEEECLMGRFPIEEFQ